MFVWVFHRVSGLLLIFLLTLQVLSGFFQSSPSSQDWVRDMAALHDQAALNCLLVFLLIFHGLYGLRTILMDLGVKKEKHLFWGCTLLGAALFGLFLALFFTLVGP